MVQYTAQNMGFALNPGQRVRLSREHFEIGRMKQLQCVVIGGRDFVIDIDERKKVAHLKDMIREKMNLTIPADLLTL